MYTLIRQIDRQTKKYVQIETRQVPNDYIYLEDEYAGLMSARDKQFITNIQLNQEYFYNQDFNLELYELELQYLYEVPNSQIIY